MDVQSVLTRPRASRAGVVQLPVGEIEPNPNQPRRDFDAEALSELAASIADTGSIAAYAFGNKEIYSYGPEDLDAPLPDFEEQTE